MPNIMAFKTVDEGGFFTVYLAFDTLDGNTLIRRKENGPHMNKKNNISFTICEQCGLKFEIVLFINAKYYGI